MSGLQNITNFKLITDQLGTSGMPQREQFAEIAAAGYEVVINLATDESPGDALHRPQLADEAEVVESLGMQYIHIPVVWESPQQADLQQFIQAMDANQGRSIYVHCVANYRVSVFVYLYRILRGDVLHRSMDFIAAFPKDWQCSSSQAYQDLTSIWTPEGVWVDFIKEAMK